MLAQLADSNLNAISFFDTAFVSQVKISEQHVLADPQ